MGPAPLKAIKEGEIYAGYDTEFVFAEVNADIVNWMLKRDENGNEIFQSNRYIFYEIPFIYFCFLIILCFLSILSNRAISKIDMSSQIASI